MAKFVKVDVKQLKQFSENMKKLNIAQIQQFNEAALKELAARLLAKVIKRTPVGKYPDVRKSGKKGGTLRRGWTAKTEAEAMSGSGDGESPATFLDSVSVTKSGNTYTIDIINPVFCAFLAREFRLERLANIAPKHLMA